MFESGCSSQVTEMAAESQRARNGCMLVGCSGQKHVAG